MHSEELLQIEIDSKVSKKNGNNFSLSFNCKTRTGFQVNFLCVATIREKTQNTLSVYSKNRNDFITFQQNCNYRPFVYCNFYSISTTTKSSFFP